jgi:23S rRNA (guanosine2251-2'-O)-methyltransferase
MSRWVFGVHPVVEVLRAQPEQVREVLLSRRGGPVREIERLAAGAGLRVRHVSRREIEEAVGAGVHQGVAAAIEGGSEAVAPDPGDPVAFVTAARDAGEVPLVLALDRIQDPRNLGALLRSAHALGAHGVVVPRDRASDLTPAAVKASAGAAAHLPVCRVTNLARALDALKDAGLWVVGADVGEDRPVEAADRADLTGPTVLVVGAEGPGLRRLVRERCDRLVEIPMPGRIGSLNASVAGGILLYEVLRQRRAAAARAAKESPA